jgi:ABC-type nickel/cobalt efflux system permease component RcnA
LSRTQQGFWCCWCAHFDSDDRDSDCDRDCDRDHDRDRDRNRDRNRDRDCDHDRDHDHDSDHDCEFSKPVRRTAAFIRLSWAVARSLLRSFC